jgi:hypothetical protein
MVERRVVREDGRAARRVRASADRQTSESRKHPILLLLACAAPSLSAPPLTFAYSAKGRAMLAGGTVLFGLDVGAVYGLESLAGRAPGALAGRVAAWKSQ